MGISTMYQGIRFKLNWPANEALPIKIRKDYYNSEYRVAYSFDYISRLEPRMSYKDKLGRIEATAYYTNDEDDAAGTAAHMIVDGYKPSK